MIDINELRLPPHYVEAEKGVLASALLDNEVMYIFDSFMIGPEDFYLKEHQIIYQSIKSLWDTRKTIDTITLSNQIIKLGGGEVTGGIDYLHELSTFLITTNQASDYAKIVKEKSILRNILKVIQQITGDVYDEKDVPEILDKIEKRIFNLTQVNLSDSLKHIKEILQSRFDNYMEIVNNPESVDKNKVLSGYAQLDDIITGFKPGELIILAARPSMGKTAIVLNIAINSAVKYRKSVAIFSLEMGADQIVDRILSLVSAIPLYKIHKGMLIEEDFSAIGDAMEKLGDSNIYIDDKGGANIMELKSKLRRLKIEKGNLDLVIIDYLQLMSAAGLRFAGNKVQEISEISRSLKELARDLKVPIIALSQLSRAVEQRPDKKPHLSDLRESGAIEQDADTVLMLYREDYYDPDTDKKGIANIYIRKNRNGPIGEIELYFEKTIMKFYDKSNNEDEGEGNYASD